jgi:hypothetical protein
MAPTDTAATTPTTADPASGSGPVRVAFCERALAVGGPELGWMRDANAIRRDGAALRAQLSEDGYLLLRGLLPTALVAQARLSVLEFLDAQGQLDRTRPRLEGWIAPGADPALPQFLGGDKAVTHTPRFLAMAECAAFFDLFATLFGEPAMTFDFKWLRAFRHAPRPANPHSDIVFMGRGEIDRLITCWTPLGDIPPEQGALAVLSGSHRLESWRRVRETYGRADVDRDNIESSLSRDPLELVARYGGRWVTSSFAAGDVLLFGMHTVHSAMQNLTARVRISADLRFQPSSAPVDERWVGNEPLSNYGWHRTPVEPVESYRARWGI